MVQAEEVLDGQKGQFDIPTPRVEPGDLAHGQLERVEHIGEVHAQLVTIAKAHQAHGPTGVGAMLRTQPDQGVQDHTLLIIDMQQLVAGLLTIATDPVEATFSQIVEPGEAEVAQIEEQ